MRPASGLEVGVEWVEWENSTGRDSNLAQGGKMTSLSSPP